MSKTCECGHHEAVHRAMCGAPEGCGCNKFVPDTPSERVEQARERVLDAMPNDCREVIEIAERDVDTLIAAVRAERDAEIRGQIEALRNGEVTFAAVLSLLSDRDGRGGAIGGPCADRDV